MPLIDALQADPAMQRYGLFHAVRGDLLQRLGRLTEARDAFERAAELATNEHDLTLMRRRIAELQH